jgi:hypothetical protein
VDLPAFDLTARRWLQRFRQTDDEIDFTDIFERDFEKPRTVAFAAARPNFNFEIMRSRIKEWEQLGILQKEIDVATLAVMKLQHHRSSATEAPIVDNRRFGVDLPNEATRDAE